MLKYFLTIFCLGPETSESELKNDAGNADEESTLHESSEYEDDDDGDVPVDAAKRGCSTSSSDAGIDPMVLKYMKMLKQQAPQNNIDSKVLLVEDDDRPLENAEPSQQDQQSARLSFGHFLTNEQACLGFN